jgi:hypothetical protein
MKFFVHFYSTFEPAIFDEMYVISVSHSGSTSEIAL